MQQFSVEHIAALVVTALAAGMLVAVARGRENVRTLHLARGLAVLILTAYLAEHLTYAVRGTWTTRINLPLQLTDAVSLVSVAALLCPGRPVLVEVLYFWAFSASLQALLTPDLGHAFPDLLYFTYFTTHSGAIVAACLLVLGYRRLPRPGAVGRVYAITLAFASLAAIGTIVTGGNYMFLRRKPQRDSLLDMLGPWPWYIFTGAVLGMLLFLALDALARAIRNWEARTTTGTPRRRTPLPDDQ